MLFLILSRIQNLSKTAVKHLKNKVTSIKIKKVQGENVEIVCSQIKSAYKALEGASTETRNYVPDDFCSSLLDVMQTSSNSEFNDTFKHEKTQVAMPTS